MAKEEHFRIVNGAALAAAATLIAASRAEAIPGGLTCTNPNDIDPNACRQLNQHSDLPVCTNGNTAPAGDITCVGELYRGCNLGIVDCADGQGQDDQCCAALLPTIGGDNIDHFYCATKDANTGGIACIWGSDSNPGPDPTTACGYLIMGFDSGQCPCE